MSVRCLIFIIFYHRGVFCAVRTIWGRSLFALCRGYLCLLRCIYTFADSRGRLSLQGEFKLPYEKEALAWILCLRVTKGHKIEVKVSKSSVRSVQQIGIWLIQYRYEGQS